MRDVDVLLTIYLFVAMVRTRPFWSLSILRGRRPEVCWLPLIVSFRGTPLSI